MHKTCRSPPTPLPCQKPYPFAIMGLLGKEHGSAHPRRALPWKRSEKDHQGEETSRYTQAEQIEALSRQIKSLTEEKESLVSKIRRLAEENRTLSYERDKCRRTTSNYQDALKNIMNYTVITASECRTRSKEMERQVSTTESLPASMFPIFLDRENRYVFSQFEYKSSIQLACFGFANFEKFSPLI